MLVSLLFLTSLVLSTFLLKAIINYAYKHNLFDKHTKRKIHHGNVPRLGGVAFVPVAILVFIFGVIFVGCFESSFKIPTMILIGLLMSMLIMYGFGMFDDIIGLRYRTKFIYQFVAGLLLCFLDVHLYSLYGLLGLFDIPLFFSCFVTILMIVLCVNSFNFIDGIDGLSSSIAILSFIYFSIIFYLINSIFFIFSVIFIGVLLPFLYFNVFGNDKKFNKIFMGDTGSTVIGLVLCVLAIIISNDANTLQIHKNPLVLAFAPLMLPCFDVFNVFTYRIVHGKNPFKPDDNHFHHRLLRIGLTQHKALVVELLLFVFMTITSIVLCNYVSINIMLSIMLSLWIVLNVIMVRNINLKSQI